MHVFRGSSSGHHVALRLASTFALCFALATGACSIDLDAQGKEKEAAATDARIAAPLPIDAALSEISDAQVVGNFTATDPNVVDDGAPFQLVHAARSKDEFLVDNWYELQRMVLRIDTEIAAAYSSHRPFTTADMVLVLYSEMALDAGNVDVDASHSLGERGLLPLPQNIEYWIGNDAPQWDELHSVEENVYAFMLYLAQVKNKSVTQTAGRTLYRDLFLHPGIDSQYLPEANLVAAVIHGYFYAGAYEEGSEVPFDSILDGLASGESLRNIMMGTGYKNATPSRIYILDGRQNNLNIASAKWHELTGL